MKHLGLSGGGTKIGGIFGAAEVLMQEKNFRPEIISGISAGSILSVPLALGKFEQIKKLILNFDLDDFFSQRPVKRNGNLNVKRVLANFVAGKPYFGRQDALEDTLAKVVSAEDFETYKQGVYPECIVGAVDFRTGARVYFRLKKLTYPQFLKAVNASSSIPIFTNPIEMTRNEIDPEAIISHHNLEDELYLFDGGVRDHIGTGFILDQYPSVSESVSIYSRPENYRVLPETFEIKNVLDVLSRYVDISNVEVSKNDEAIERFIYQNRNIPHTFVFLPQVMESVYDTDPDRLQKMYTAGREMAEKAYPTPNPDMPPPVA